MAYYNLLDRDSFRVRVFDRDKYKCVNCGEPAVDAHHIMERRLFHDGGYYINNGVSLCEDCHILAEKTLLSTDELREKASITERILPEHLYHDHNYDKWGNIINPNGTRIKGELFYDPSVQKIIPLEIKALFLSYVKYPRTFHLPWSESRTADDRVHENLDFFIGKEVVVLEKRDGENSSVYSDGYFHARSIDGNNHPSQDWLKNHIQNWFFELPTDWRVCGENLYALHSIKYNNLQTYFEVFNIWNENNECISWKETKEWCELLKIETVPVLYEGPYDEYVIKGIKLDTALQEGYVIRLSESFPYSKFRYSTAKFVRKNHVNTTVHNWRMGWTKDKCNHRSIENEIN